MRGSGTTSTSEACASPTEAPRSRRRPSGPADSPAPCCRDSRESQADRPPLPLRGSPSRSRRGGAPDRFRNTQPRGMVCERARIAVRKLTPGASRILTSGPASLDRCTRTASRERKLSFENRPQVPVRAIETDVSRPMNGDQGHAPCPTTPATARTHRSPAGCEPGPRGPGPGKQRRRIPVQAEQFLGASNAGKPADPGPICPPRIRDSR